MALKELHQGHVPAEPVPPGNELTTLLVANTVVARYCDGSGLPAELAPRPFLHPITTLSGVVVSDAQPDDHRWHLGLCIALQDVGGTNVWGGRTYRRDAGYTWLRDHGRQEHVRWRSRAPGSFVEDLAWLDPDGRSLLTETRSAGARPSTLPGAWLLDLSFELQNATQEPLLLGSPATNGRPGAGYGGLFWRLPAVAGAGRVFSTSADGETGTHGTRAPWLACSVAGPAAWTVALAGADDATREDLWFVRVSDYPGLGSQLAAERPVQLPPGATTSRRFTALVADGVLDARSVEQALAEPRPAQLP